MRNRFTLYLCLFCFITFLSGCSGNGLRVNKVEGTVTWNGEPVDGATIMFLPTQEGPNAYMAFGTTDAEGKYTLTSQASEFGSGAVVGPYKVTIAKAQPGTTGRPSRTSQLPGTYAEVSMTPLTVEVVRGRNTLDFTLEGKAPPKAPVARRVSIPTGPPPGVPVPE